MDEAYDISGEDSSDDYEKAQLEIALYSQIHFEQDNESQSLNTEHGVSYNEDGAVDQEFIFSVKGNERKGFFCSDSNADIILKEVLEEKYSGLNFTGDVNKRTEDKKLVIGKSKAGKFSDSSPSMNRHKKSFDNSMLGRKVTNNSTKISPKHKSENDRKTLSAEKLFLETNSDSDERDDTIVIDNEEEKDKDNGDDVDMVYLSDSSDIVLSEGSEADSLDILLGEPEDGKDDIQMNVRSNLRYTYRKMSHEDAVPDKEENNACSDDASHWAICREDSYRDLISATRRQSGRYYKPIKCHNCDRDGHLSKNCPQPKKMTVCIMCSEPGHMSRTCPQAMCFNCQEPGHDSKQCMYPRRSLQYTCFRCNMKGHDQSRCPDNWRQFHLTVTPEKIHQLEVKSLKKTPSCFNCGEEGHLGHECEEDRMNKFITVYTPFICRYQTMKEFNFKMRQADEAEDRPIKRSRSDGWLSNSANRRNNLEPYNHRIFDDSDVSKKAYINDVPECSEDFPRGKDRSKTCKFAHIVKKRPGIPTGRNNFDKMQFTVLNTRKEGWNNGKKTGATAGNDEKSKSKKKKKKNKDGKEKAEDNVKKAHDDKGKNITRLEGFRDAPGKSAGKSSNKIKMLSNEAGKNKRYDNKNNLFQKNFFRDISVGNEFADKKSIGSLNNSEKGENQSNSDQCVIDVTFSPSKDDSSIHSDVKNRRNDTKFLTSGSKIDLTGKGESKHRKLGNKGQKRKPRFQLGTDVIDLTIDKDTDRRSCKEKKLEDNERKFSNVMNDRQRSDDLFSIQKIVKLQSSHRFDMPNEVEGDIEHQVHNNEWWRNQRNRRKRQNRKRNRKLNNNN